MGAVSGGGSSGSRLLAWLWASLCLTARGAGAQQAGNGTSVRDPYFHADYMGEFDEHNVDVTGVGYTAVDYVGNEEAWFRISPCAAEGSNEECTVLLWFTSFMTEAGLDVLTVFDGETVAVDETGAPMDPDCEEEACLAQLSGNDGEDPYGEVKTTEILGVYTGDPLLIRSRSKVVWLWWQTNSEAHFPGFAIKYKTDSPTDARLQSLSLSYQITGQPVDLDPPVFRKDVQRYSADMPALNDYSIEVTVSPHDDTVWDPWMVTHPSDNVGQVLDPPTITVNGEAYSEGMVVKLDSGLAVQPIVVSIRAMDNRTYMDYVVYASPWRAEAVNDTIESAVRPDPPVWFVGAESGGWITGEILPSSMSLVAGDFLDFRIMSGAELWLLAHEGCPSPYDGQQLATYLDSPFELELDEPGTFHFAGATRVACQSGQSMVVDVAPDLGLLPNLPESAKALTVPRISGADFAPADKPTVTGTQWDARPVSSMAGWDGFHEWFRFHVHRGETVTIAITLGEGMFFAVANVWDEAFVLQNVTTTGGDHDGDKEEPETQWEGARKFAVQWTASATGAYYLTVRSFIVDEMRERGYLYGSYSLMLTSDWEDRCISWAGPKDSAGRPIAAYSRVGAPCGDYGNCEAIEDFERGEFTPQCVCTHRYAGEACEHSPPAPMIVKLLGSTAVDGGVGEEHFKTALSTAVDRVEPATIAVTAVFQRATVLVDLPGSPADYDRETPGGRAALAQVTRAARLAFKDQLPTACQMQPDDSSTSGSDGNGCVLQVVAVRDYLDTHNLRKREQSQLQQPAGGLLASLNYSDLDMNSTNATASNTTVNVTSYNSSALSVGDGLYWPDPADPACSEYRCYDPDCLDVDVTDWRPFLRANPLANETNACGGRGLALDWTGGAINWSPQEQRPGFGYNQDCRLQLQCPLNHIAELSLSAFELEAKDRLVVLDGQPVDDILVGSPSGAFESLDSTVFRTVSNVMTLVFTSDDADVSVGFAADYQCVPVTVSGDTPPPPPPPLFGKNCKDLVADAAMLGIGCNANVSTFVHGQPLGQLLKDVCPASCASCVPYLGAPGSIVTLYVEADADLSEELGAGGFPAKLAELLDTSGSQLQSLMGNQKITAAEVAIAGNQFTTDLDFEVTIGRATAEDARITSLLTQQWLASTIIGNTFVDFLNRAGATTATDSVVTKMLVDTGTEAEALALAEILNAESSHLLSLAADGQGNPVRWFSEAGAKSVEAKLDASARMFESRQGRRNAVAAAELYIAAGQAGVLTRQQVGSVRDGRSPAEVASGHTQMPSGHPATTVAIAAAAAEEAAASVLGIDLQDGEHLQNGFKTYARDMTPLPHTMQPHENGVKLTPDDRMVEREVEHVSTTRQPADYVGSVETSSGGGTQPADFTQSLGDPSRAAVAAATSAAAAKLLATGANDAHPLDHLAPILSQAPSSQAFSDDPYLPSSTSRFSAQTDHWWIPDYLPGGRPPEQPDPPVVMRYDDTTVELSWNAPFDWGIPIEGYVLEMRSCDVFYETQSASDCDGYYGPGEYVPVQPSHRGTETRHLVLSLQPGRMYFFHVRAYNAFDRYMSPNNYGVWSYDSLAVTLWRVPDKIDPPVPHKIECVEPLTSTFAVLEGLDDRDTPGVHRDRLRSRANCSIELSWVKPFAGAVENPLVDRSHDIRGNAIINYRIFYFATPKAPLVYPPPDSYVDQNGVEWLEIPHPPDLRSCRTDYFQPCPDGWQYHEDVEYGNQVCTQHGNTNGTGVCGSPQIFDRFELEDKISWEEMCNASWAQHCDVATETTIHGLQDTTEYYFIVTAVNRGGLGAIRAPYHPSVSTGASRGSAGGNSLELYGHHINYTVEGAGFVRNKPARRLWMPDADGDSRGGTYKQTYGEGDFSDPSRYQSMQIRPGTRVLARDRRCPRWPGETEEMLMGSPLKECIIPVPQGENPAEGSFRPLRRDPDDFRVLEDVGNLYEGTDVSGEDRQRDGTPVRPAYPVAGHADPEDGPVQLEGVWYYPATVVSSTADGAEVSVVYDAICQVMVYDEDTAQNVPTGEYAPCADSHMSRKEVLIDTLSTGLGRALHPGAVTWRVPDAPLAPTFGTVTETTVEVHWNPPNFDGNTNHEMLYADPRDTASGGVVLGYRLFVQRYDDSTGHREEWMEHDIAYLGTNTSHVVTNLDSDVVYIFTVTAYNIIGDSPHSQEAEAPITLEAPIPQGTVSQTLWPLVPEIQPRLAFAPTATTHRLACTNENMRSTLLASTIGGGTNAAFHWTLWREYELLTITPAVYYNEEITVEYPVEDPELMRTFALNGQNITIFENTSGVYRNWTEYRNDTVAQASYTNSTILRELVRDFGGGGNDCCTIDIPDGDYILQLNTSNTRGSVVTEDPITFSRCGCMDIFNAEFDYSAHFHLPEMCDSTTFEGAAKTASEGEFVYYEQMLSDSVFAVEFQMTVESGSVDFYASTKAPPQLAHQAHDVSFHNLSSQQYQQVPWEYRVPFNVLMLEPNVGIRTHARPFIEVSSSLFAGVYGVDDFSRFSIRARTVKFPEERINLPEWEASNDMTETGRYKFYELHFADSQTDMDVKVSVQCKVGNVTLFVAKKDKYPSEWRSFTQTATTAAGGLAEVIDTWQPDEDRVVFLAVRGNAGGFTLGYPNEPAQINEYIITARSYRYSPEATILPTLPDSRHDEDPGHQEDNPLASPDVTPPDRSSGSVGGKDSAFVERETTKRKAADAKNPEDERYQEVALDEFNYYRIEYSDMAYAIEATVQVSHGVLDLYANFDTRPTQARYYQRAAALYESVAITVPFNAVVSGVGHLYLGVFGREIGSSSYNISVVERRFANATGPCTSHRRCDLAPTLINGTWLEGMTNSEQQEDASILGIEGGKGDGYRFYRSHVGPEPTELGVTRRSGPGTKAQHPGTDPETWSADWSEDWVKTWEERYDDHYDFDVFATVTVHVYTTPLEDLFAAAEAQFAPGEDLSGEEIDALDLQSRIAGGVDVYAALDFPYPSAERVRDAETHQLGGYSSLTVATLTLPVWTDFGRTMHVGVRTERPGVRYDIKVEYSVQEEEAITTPVAHPHEPCPSVAVRMSHAGPGVTMQVECNGHGACIAGRCVCETGYYGKDCATVAFSEAEAQPSIRFLAPGQGTVWSTVPVSLAFTVANAPPSARVLLYVDGLPYPKEHTNVLAAGTSGLAIWGLYSGRHTAQLVLETVDGETLTSGMSHFVVASPGGCANDCSRQGLCMDAHAGQYCICNDGWTGVDCSKVDTWFADRGRNGTDGGGAVAGAGLSGNLMLQLEQNLQKGMLHTRLDLEALARRVASNDESVLGRKDAAERAMESFRLQVEADDKELALQHEVLLDELHRGRDQFERDTEERGSALRRTLTARAEQQHATERGLHEDTQRRQNRFSRIQRKEVCLSSLRY